MIFRDGNTAIVDIAKLRLYCLDPAHPLGAHKARAFARMRTMIDQPSSQPYLFRIRTSAWRLLPLRPGRIGSNEMATSG